MIRRVKQSVKISTFGCSFTDRSLIRKLAVVLSIFLDQTFSFSMKNKSKCFIQNFIPIQVIHYSETVRHDFFLLAQPELANMIYLTSRNPYKSTFSGYLHNQVLRTNRFI